MSLSLENVVRIVSEESAVSAAQINQTSILGMLGLNASGLDQIESQLAQKFSIDFSGNKIVPATSVGSIIQFIDHELNLRRLKELGHAPYDASLVQPYVDLGVLGSMEHLLLIYDKDVGQYYCFTENSTSIAELRAQFVDAFVSNSNSLTEKNGRLYVDEYAFGQALRHAAICVPHKELLKDVRIKPSASGKEITIEASNEVEDPSILFRQMALWDIPVGTTFDESRRLLAVALAGGKFRGAGELLEKAGLARQ